jgi:hypothetical protein
MGEPVALVPKHNMLYALGANTHTPTGKAHGDLPLELSERGPLLKVVTI